MARKIVVTNQKGGVGKTTTAIMLAQELKGHKKKVLIIDMDGQMNTTRFYKCQTEDEATLADIFYQSKDVTIHDCIHHQEYGDIIPSDEELKEAETKIAADEMRFLRLKLACKEIEDEYDYIIMDTPPAIGVILKNAFAYADDCIIPISEDGWSINGVMDVVNAIMMAKQTTNPNLNILGLVIVNSTPHTRQAKRISELAEKLAENIGTRVFKTQIRRSVRIREALTEFYTPLYIYDKSCTSQLDYEDFVEELLGIYKKERKGKKA